MTYILGQRDKERLEGTVRKVERMARQNLARRHPVYTGLGGGVGLVWPTDRKTYSGVDGASDPIDIYLTRDDREIIHWFDSAGEMVAHPGDSGERIWWLPADPEVGDTFFLESTSGADMWVRMSAYDHGLIGPLVYSLKDVTESTPGWIPSTFFNRANEQWERVGFGLYFLNSQPNIVRTVVITYTGKIKSAPISYEDPDHDNIYTPYDPITHPGIPEHPLIYGDFKMWSVCFAENVVLYQPYLCVFDQSTTGPFG